MQDEADNKRIWKGTKHPAKTQITISEPIFRWVLTRSGLSIDDLQHTLPKLSKWIKGEIRPTLPDVEKLAKITSTPLGFFFLQEPPIEKLSIPHCRTLGNQQTEQPSPNLIETIQSMERRQDWMREYLLEQGQKPLRFIKSAHPEDKPEQVASEIRNILGLTETWAAEQPNWSEALQKLRTKIEESGILVVVSGIVGNNTHRKLDVVEFRGFVLVDEYAPLIFVNGADGKAAQMFTLAHELAHIWFGKSAIFDLTNLRPANDPIETVSNQVAAEFLIPAKQLQEYWPSVNGLLVAPYPAIAYHFKVSELVAAYRTLNLGLISNREFDEFYQDYETKHHTPQKKSTGGDFYATLNLRIGRRFAMAVINATREGSLLYRDAYNLTGLYGETFEKYAKSLGMGVSK